MKTRSLLTYALLPAAGLLLLAASCNLIDRSAQSWSLPRPVSIVGGEEWMNGYPLWHAWLSPNIDGGAAGLLLRDGDVFGGRNTAVYHTKDGLVLKATDNAWSVVLGEQVVSVSLENGPEGREWLDKASKKDLAAIRLLILPKKGNAELRPALTRLAAANPGVALKFSSDALLKEVLPLFRPQMLFLIDFTPGAEARSIIADQQEIRTLVIRGGTPGCLEVLPRLHNLRRLTIMEWQVEKAGPLPAGLDALRSISVVGSTMKDLSALEASPAGLEELSIQGDELADVHALTRWPRLKALLLSGNEKLVGLPDLAGLKQLQWVGLPQETTQEQFAAFVAAHPNLKILELVGCETVTDLAPLRDLKELEGLVIVAKPDQRLLDSLRDLKSLRFLGLPKEAFEESAEQVAAIRKALPDALVVPVSGLCLGSGWILLLIPAIAGVRFLRRRHATADACHG